MKRCKHEWTTYFCDLVSERGGSSLRHVKHGADIGSFSVCEKCGAVCYGNKEGKVVTMFPKEKTNAKHDGCEKYASVIEDMSRVINAYEGQNAQLSCQGQGMDGYTALAEFVSIARKARELRPTEVLT